MTLFDLLFIVIFLSTVGVLLSALVSVLRGRRPNAARWLRRLGIFWAAYMAVVIAVSVATPQRFFEVHERQCWDDWCIGVEGLKVAPAIGRDPEVRAQGSFYVVTLRVSSRARRVAQRAPDTTVYLLDGGNRYEVSRPGQVAYERANGEAPSFGTLVEAGASFNTVRVFDIPKDARDVALVVIHGAGPPIGWLIIGENPLRKPKMRLPQPE